MMYDMAFVMDVDNARCIFEKRGPVRQRGEEEVEVEVLHLPT
jgi:hypothetical protein